MGKKFAPPGKGGKGKAVKAGKHGDAPHKAGKPKRKSKYGDDGGMHRNDVDVEKYDKVISLKKPVGKKSGVVDRKGASVKKHKSELASLEDKDPEFFNFLRKNDKSLLEFGGDDEDDEDEDDDDDDEGSDVSGVRIDDDGDIEGMEFDQDDDDDNDNDNDDDDEGDEEDEQPSRSRKASKERASVELSAALLAETADRACGGSVAALKK